MLAGVMLADGKQFFANSLAIVSTVMKLCYQTEGGTFNFMVETGMWEAPKHLSARDSE